MGVARLAESGKIYEDDFSNTSLDPRWEVSPNDSTRYLLNGESLEIFHGDSPFYMFLPELSTVNQFVLDVKNLYNPEVEGNVGGIVVYSDDDNFIELEEYLNTSLPTPMAMTYPWIRLVRDYNTYSAYWSDDGMTWNLIGVQGFDNPTPKIGLFLRSEFAGATPASLIVEYVRVFKSVKAAVGNLNSGTKVQLIDAFGSVQDTKICRTGTTSVSFDLQHYPIPFVGNFIITLPDGNQFQSSDPIEIYGGDLYYFEVKLDIYYRETRNDGAYTDILLYENMERFLGYMATGANGYRDVLMYAKNSLSSGTFKGIQVELISYKGTDDYMKWVQVDEDNGGVPTGFWGNKANLPNIPHGSAAYFWVKLLRPATFTSEIAFGFRVTSSYL